LKQTAFVAHTNSCILFEFSNLIREFLDLEMVLEKIEQNNKDNVWSKMITTKGLRDSFLMGKKKAETKNFPLEKFKYNQFHIDK
jgi:hypothetical protein